MKSIETEKFDSRRLFGHRQTNIFDDLYTRDVEGSIESFKSKYIFSPRLVKHLNFDTELKGHDGCVNCLEWNQSGTLLASGSDDLNIILWSALSASRDRQATHSVIPTKHRGNIFGVKFLPHTRDSLVASCAADRDIYIYDVNHSTRPLVAATTSSSSSSSSGTFSRMSSGDLPSPLHSIHAHTNRVKRIETSQSEPFLVWSCGEDGLVLEHDIRLPKSEMSRVVVAYAEATASFVTGEKNAAVTATRYGKSSSNKSDAKESQNRHRRYLASLETKCLAVNQMRSEYLAVGCNDPYARVYDRRALRLRRMPERGLHGSPSTASNNVENSLFEYTLADGSEKDSIPVSFFVPGHLPLKLDEYRKRMKTLSITFLTFSPQGDQLLVNLGGEQLYLFDYLVSKNLDDDSNADCESVKTFKVDAYKELFKNTINNDGSDGGGAEKEEEANLKKKLPPTKVELPPKVEALKRKANAFFEHERYVEAIEYYNRAVKLAPRASVLYGNRAAALLKRAWDGDFYAAMRDCYQAMSLDPTHVKSHFRLAKCLSELGWHEHARDCLNAFRLRFPDYARTEPFEKLFNETNEKLNSNAARTATSAAKTTTTTNTTTSTASSKHKRFKSSSNDDNQGNTSENGKEENKEDSEEEEEESTAKNEKENDQDDESDNDSDLNDKGDVEEKVINFMNGCSKKSGRLIANYQNLQANSRDFAQRYCGHCNVATDIKEANFIGEEFIGAGSDDGCIFIWDRASTNVVRVLKGDESIVNCVQPHPNTCCVATSGIDPHVRLWSPKLGDVDDILKKKKKRNDEEKKKIKRQHRGDDRTNDSEDNDDDDDDDDDDGDENDSRVVRDIRTAEINNHSQMNSNPFEFFYLNMAQGTDWSNEDDEEVVGGYRGIQCRPS